MIYFLRSRSKFDDTKIAYNQLHKSLRSGDKRFLLWDDVYTPRSHSYCHAAPTIENKTI